MMPFHKTPEKSKNQDGFCGMTQRMLARHYSEVITCVNSGAVEVNTFLQL
jgi:hypothetical protein